MRRAIVIVLDSVGIGGAPDAAAYGDLGANTVGHIAERCRLHLPHLAALGLGEACRSATGQVPPGLDRGGAPLATCGSAVEVSKGKDTPSGHWEIAGVPVATAWGTFPDMEQCFPAALVEALCDTAHLPGILGNRHASGTRIIDELGQAHIETGMPICYTSADSVFQIAAHETSFGLERLYEVCLAARELTRPLRIGRVIARPFSGDGRGEFRRTSNRRDFAEAPPHPTILEIATREGRDVASLGKTADIFAHAGTGREIKGSSNADVMDKLIGELPALRDGGLLFANLVDFDSEFGHRRDVPGYAAALEAFDARAPALLASLLDDDLLIITADHGCDPTWRGSDHTREQVPVLAYGRRLPPRRIGRRESFADIGASVCEHLRLPPPMAGVSFLR